LILNDGSLQGVGQLPAEFCGKPGEKGLVDQIALGAVGQPEAPPLDTSNLVFHSDRGRETAEEQPVRLQDAPGSAQHGIKVIVVTCEVEDGAADHYVGKMIREGHMFERLYSKIVRRQRSGEAARGRNRLRIQIDAETFIPRGEKVVKVSPEPAARIEDFHAGPDTAAKELIEQIDIDLAELFSKGGQCAISGRCGKRRRPS
jgi:hypothetical protein